MRRILLAILAASAAVACSAGQGPPRPSPAASHAPSPSPVLRVLPPADLILSGPQAGLAVSGGRDHLDLDQAASLEQNQPLALTRFRSWGWVDEATRDWGQAPGPSLSESLLLLTGEDGARLAFSGRVSDYLRPPWTEAACPQALGLDQCAEAESSGRSLLVGRAGPYVVYLLSAGVDVDAEAALQLQGLRG